MEKLVYKSNMIVTISKEEIIDMAERIGLRKSTDEIARSLGFEKASFVSASLIPLADAKSRQIKTYNDTSLYVLYLPIEKFTVTKNILEVVNKTMSKTVLSILEKYSNERNKWIVNHAMGIMAIVTEK